MKIEVLSNKENKLRNPRWDIVIGLFFCILVVFLIFLHTLNRPWIFFDERLIFEEITVPIPRSINELFEIICSFGTSYSFDSNNSLYTSNSNHRVILFGAPYLLLLGLILGKNVFLYHSLNLLLHLVNTSIVYLILRKCFDNSNFLSRAISLLLTCIWAVHLVQIESILLSSNIGATFGYLIVLLVFYDFLKNRNNNISNLKKIIFSFCFVLVPMILHEYIIFLPLVLFGYLFLEKSSLGNFQNALKTSWLQCQPYFIGLLFYFICLLFLSEKSKFLQNSPEILFERIFWLSPQIFIHFLELILFPKVLSIDQTGHVYLSKVLFSSHSIFCFAFLALWLFVPLVLFLWRKKTYPFLMLSWLFFLSLLPFLQILSPTYCLAAERYLYIPLFVLIFGIAKILSGVTSQKFNSLILLLLSFILISCIVRSYYRTNDWKDSFSLLHSAIETSPNDLYKGFRFNTLADTTFKFKPEQKEEAQKYFKKSKEYFSEEIKQIKKEKETSKAEPLILKSYGLDQDSLLIKTIYLKCIGDFVRNEESYKGCLEEFQPYLKNIEDFDARTLELYANLLVKNGEISNAKDIFLLAYKKYPTSPFILLSLIRFEREIEKNLSSAKKYLQEALKLYPYSKEILFETLRTSQLENNLQDYAKYSYLYGLRTHSKFHFLEALAGYNLLGDFKNAQKTSKKLSKL